MDSKDQSSVRFTTAVSQTGINESVAVADVRTKKLPKELDVQAVSIYDPTTGSFLGASSFFRALKTLSFTQAAAVQNQWYTAFSGTNVIFNALGIGIIVANETVEARITIDGTTYAVAGGIALLFGTNKFTNVLANGLALTSGTPVITLGAASATLTGTVDLDTWLSGKSVLIEVRKTTAGGASAIQVFGVYYQ